MVPKPLTSQALNDLIVERMVRYGFECDLNDIDVSAVTDFSNLFKGLAFVGYTAAPRIVVEIIASKEIIVCMIE